MSVLERCPSYKESNKGNKQRQEPTLGVRLIEVSIKRESTVNANLNKLFMVKYSNIEVVCSDQCCTAQ